MLVVVAETAAWRSDDCCSHRLTGHTSRRTSSGTTGTTSCQQLPACGGSLQHHHLSCIRRFRCGALAATTSTTTMAIDEEAGGYRHTHTHEGRDKFCIVAHLSTTALPLREEPQWQPQILGVVIRITHSRVQDSKHSKELGARELRRALGQRKVLLPCHCGCVTSHPHPQQVAVSSCIMVNQGTPCTSLCRTLYMFHFPLFQCISALFHHTSVSCSQCTAHGDIYLSPQQLSGF